MSPTGFFKRGSIYRASAMTLIVLMAPAPGVPLLAAVRAPSRAQGTAAAANAVQQNATDVAVTMWGPAAKNWSSYKNPDGSVITKSPSGQQVVRANPDGSNDIWQRDWEGRWENGKLVAGVYLAFGNSQTPGDHGPPKKPSDAIDLPPLTDANMIYVGGEKAPIKPPASAQAAQAAVAAAIAKAKDDQMAKVDGLKGDWTINGVQLAPATVAGLMTIRDIYSKQLKFFEDFARTTLGKSDAEKIKIIEQILPAVNTAKLWIDLRDHFRSDNLAGWHDYFDQQKQKALAAGDTKTADLIDSAGNLRNGRSAAEQFMIDQINKALDSHPLVAALSGQISGQATGPASSYLTAFNTAVKDAMDKATLERGRVDAINTVQGMTEFFNPQYQKVWGAAANAYGKYSQAWFKHFLDNASAFSTLTAIIDRKWDDVLAAGVLGLAIVSIIIPPLAIALGAKAFAGMVVVGAAGTSLVASGTQLVWDGERAWTINTAANNAAAGQSALGADAVRQLNDQANAAIKQAVLDGGVVILDAVGLGMAVNEYKGLAKAQALDNAKAAARLNPEYAAQQIVAKLPAGQAKLLQEAGLLPTKTIKVGGRTFHISPFFEGPGRTSVMAFEETAAGVQVRIWYVSGEHGIWKAAPSIKGGLLGKGPQIKVITDGKTVRLKPPGKVPPGWKERTTYVNEGVVDLSSDLQGVLFNELKTAGVKTEGKLLDAFYGNMEYVTPGSLDGLDELIPAASGMPLQNAVNRPFPRGPGAVPNPVPTSSWTADLPLYGPTEGFTFVSKDGNLTYVVLRYTDSSGNVRVFVPSVQETTAVVTPYGTKATAVNSPFSGTPIRHERPLGLPDPPGVRSIPGNDEYVFWGNLNNNKLNEHFGTILPPQGMLPPTNVAPVRPLPQTATGSASVGVNSPGALGAGAVINAGRANPGSATFDPATSMNPFAEPPLIRATTPITGRGLEIPTGNQPNYSGLDSFGKLLNEKMGIDAPSATPDYDESVRYQLDTGLDKGIKFGADLNYTPSTPNPPAPVVTPSVGMYVPRFGEPGVPSIVLGSAGAFTGYTPSVFVSTPEQPTPLETFQRLSQEFQAGLAGRPLVNGFGATGLQPFWTSFNGVPATPFPAHNVDGAWSSCSSCHPNGLTDNVTWSFGSPWTNLSDSVFIGRSDAVPNERRVFNWTAIFDEMQDFEDSTGGEQGEGLDGGLFFWNTLIPMRPPESLADRLMGAARGLRQWAEMWFVPRATAWRGSVRTSVGDGGITIRQRPGSGTTTAAGTGKRVTEALSSAGRVSISFIATGNATGDAFKMRVVNPTGEPLAITVPDGLVLEPVNATAPPAPAGAREFAVSGYCAEFAKPSPKAGGLYRIASAAQQSFKDAKYLLRAARRLMAKNELRPDSEPELYAQSIRQYALWAQVENWDLKKFGDNLLARTKKNMAEAKQPWTSQIETAIKAVTPNRWQDIQKVMQDAKALKAEVERR